MTVYEITLQQESKNRKCFTKAPRLRAPHGARRGKDVFPQRYWQDFHFKLLLVPHPPRGRPFGGGRSHRSGGRALHLIRINQQYNMSKMLRSQENNLLRKRGVGEI